MFGCIDHSDRLVCLGRSRRVRAPRADPDFLLDGGRYVVSFCLHYDRKASGQYMQVKILVIMGYVPRPFPAVRCANNLQQSKCGVLNSTALCHNLTTHQHDA